MPDQQDYELLQCAIRRLELDHFGLSLCPAEVPLPRTCLWLLTRWADDLAAGTLQDRSRRSALDLAHKILAANPAVRFARIPAKGRAAS